MQVCDREGTCFGLGTGDPTGLGREALADGIAGGAVHGTGEGSCVLHLSRGGAGEFGEPPTCSTHSCTNSRSPHHTQGLFQLLVWWLFNPSHDPALGTSRSCVPLACPSHSSAMLFWAFQPIKKPSPVPSQTSKASCDNQVVTFCFSYADVACEQLISRAQGIRIRPVSSSEVIWS